MKPLTANLKTLYQRNLLWLFHIIFIGVSFGIATINEFGTYDYSSIAGLMFMYFMYGAVMGIILFEIISKPFSFCLSSQIKAIQNMLLIIWLSLMVIFFLVFGWPLYENFGTDYSDLILTTGLLSLSFWLGVFIFSPKKTSFAPLLILILLILTISNKSRLDNIDAEVLYRAYTWIIFFACVILSYLVYRSLGYKENIRNLRIALQLGIDKYIYYKSHPFPEGASTFFLRRIRSNNNSKFLAHLWGQVYLVIGPLYSIYWNGILLHSVLFGFCIVFLFSRPERVPELVIFDLAVLISASLFFSITFNKNRFDSFLLVERRGYLWRRIVFLLTNILKLLCFISVCVLLINQLTGSLFVVKWILLTIPIIMLPLFGGLVIFFRKDNSAVQIALMVLTYLIALGLSYWTYTIMKNTSPLIDLIIILSAAVITWGFHIAILYYDSMKRSLC